MIQALSPLFVGDIPLRLYQDQTCELVCHKDGEGTVSFQHDSEKIWGYSFAPGRSMLYIDAGLGKSRIGIECYDRLCPSTPLLVVCSKKALNTWRREPQKWLSYVDALNIKLMNQQPAKRKGEWATSQALIHVVTYETCYRDLSMVQALIKRMGIKMIIADEAHKAINRKTNSWKALNGIAHLVPYFLPMSATFQKRGPQDLWAILNLLDRKKFPSYWFFINKFCHVIDGAFGKEIIGPQNTKELGLLLTKYGRRLRDKDEGIAKQRPPLSRDLLEVRQTPGQAKLYKSMNEEMLAILGNGEGVIAAPSHMAKLLRLRQILACPKIIDPSADYGGGIEHLLMEAEDDPHMVIFCPFVPGLDFIREAFVGKKYPQPFILKGGSTPDDVARVEEKFNSPAFEETACVVSTKFAESFELYTAKQCFALGYDWDQNVNYQAEKRLHRLITPQPVNSWYLQYPDTTDGRLLEVLNEKQFNVNLTWSDYIKMEMQKDDQ